MGRIVAIILLSFCMFFESKSQNWESTFIAKNVENVAADNLGNLYIISPEGQIKKLNSKGDSVGLFNNVRQLGAIESIDVTNPLKVLVFYKNFSIILVLDRFMNVKATIDLRRQNILQASTIALSFDNLIWVYDEVESKVKKMDENGNISFESTDLRMVFDTIKPIEKIIDNDGKLYLYNQTQGLLQFDYYGGFKKKFSFLHYSEIFVNNNVCYLFKDSVIEVSNLQLLTSLSKKYPLIHQSSKTFLQGNKIYFIKSKELFSTTF